LSPPVLSTPCFAVTHGNSNIRFHEISIKLASINFERKFVPHATHIAHA